MVTCQSTREAWADRTECDNKYAAGDRTVTEAGALAHLRPEHDGRRIVAERGPGDPARLVDQRRGAGRHPKGARDMLDTCPGDARHSGRCRKRLGNTS